MSDLSTTRTESPPPPDPAKHSADVRLLSIEEAAEALGISRSGCYNLLSTGALASVKLGRRRLITTAAIAEFVTTVTDDAPPQASTDSPSSAAESAEVLPGAPLELAWRSIVARRSVRRVSSPLPEWSEDQALGELADLVAAADCVDRNLDDLPLLVKTLPLLVEASLSLHATLIAAAGVFHGPHGAPDRSEAWDLEVQRARELLTSVATSIGEVLRTRAETGAPSERAAEELRRRVGSLTRWTSEQVYAADDGVDR